MKINGKKLLRIDRFFWLPYRLSEYLLKVVRQNQPGSNDKRIVIKFMGLGSLLQIAALFDKHQVDKGKLVLITLAPNRELCALLDLTEIWYVRTNNIFLFTKDCIAILLKAKSLRPLKIIDYERCSNAVGLYRTLLAAVAKCPSISFEKRKAASSDLQIIYAVDDFTQEELFIKGIEFLPKQNHEEFLKTVEIQSQKVIININASNYLLARRYPIDSFAEVIKSLHRWNHQLEFYLTGSPTESPYVKDLENRVSGLSLHNVAGKWSLEKLCVELSTCALFITGDSGPLHLAAYLSVHTLAIWGPTQPEHFGYGEKENMLNISLRLPCSPCFKHPASHPADACNGRIDCMKNIEASIIAKKAIELLSHVPETRSIHTFGKSIYTSPSFQPHLIETTR